MTQHTKNVITHRLAVNSERKHHFNLILWFGLGTLLLSMGAAWGWEAVDDSALHVPNHPTYQQFRHACIEGLVAC